MPKRGNPWEMTYEPECNGPAQNANLDDLTTSSGFVECRIVNKDGKPTQVKWSLKDNLKRHFQKCDFALLVQDSHISNCTFTSCRFNGSTWKNVKFSKCTFEKCDFSNARFDQCYFVDSCAFLQNSASAELFRMEGTAISASAFISNLETNLKYFPEDQWEFQKSRFCSTRAKISKTILSSTRNEADIDYYFQAYEQLIRCTLINQIERHRFDENTGSRNSLFILRTLPQRFEQVVIEVSGWLTNWGRSMVRPGVFFCATVCLFTAVYRFFEPSINFTGFRQIGSACIEALNITLVAGYTAYFKSDACVTLQLLWLLNLLIGLFWYSLIIPVVTRRILR